MGLLDGLMNQALGGLLNSSGPQAQSMMQMALQVLQQNGGVGGVVDMLQRAGYGQEAASWVGTGANQPIPAEAMQQALGSEQLGTLASRLGIAPGDAAGAMASMLPQVIDGLTPQGQIPDNHGDLVAQALSMLQRGRSA